MTCTTHIVDCLRSIGIEPEAFASSEYSSTYKASNVLRYDTSTEFQSYYPVTNAQWWGVNFKRKISLTGYQIRTGTADTSYRYIYNWTFLVSLDNITWKKVHEPIQNGSEDKNYNFNSPQNALYAKIEGNSLSSSQPKSIRIYYVKFFASPTTLRNAITCKFRRGINTNLMRLIILIYS